MGNSFSKFFGTSKTIPSGGVSKEGYVYCLIKAPIAMYLDQQNKLSNLISSLFCLIEETGGDINCFCCDTLLALYGLPLEDGRTNKHIHELIIRLSNTPEQLTTIIGKDRGFYGAFGCDKRMTVTALGPELLNDFQTINTLFAGSIYIHWNIAQEIKDVENVQHVKIIEHMCV